MSKMNPIVEKAIRKKLKKPTGELAKADLGKVVELSLHGTKINDCSSHQSGQDWGG